MPWALMVLFVDRNFLSKSTYGHTYIITGRKGNRLYKYIKLNDILIQPHSAQRKLLVSMKFPTTTTTLLSIAQVLLVFIKDEKILVTQNCLIEACCHRIR